MSLMYEMLDHYAEVYEEEMSEQDHGLLMRAINRLEEAYEEEGLEQFVAGLHEATALAKKLADDEVSYLFDFHLANALIGSANQMDEGIAIVLPGAIATRSAEYDDKPHRIGLNNMLACAYAATDPVAHADEIREIVEMVGEASLADSEDLSIALSSRYECELALGNLDDARNTCDQISQCVEELDSILYYISFGTFETELAYLEQDWEGMLAAAERCWELLVIDQSRTVEEGSESEDEEDDFEDADFETIAAAEACALAKLGRGDEVEEPEVDNPNPDSPAQYNFYLYWCEFHQTQGNQDVAIAMAKAGVEETTGKGQHFREAQMICVLLRMLAAAGQVAEIPAWAEKARAVASRLQDPSPMLKQIDAAIG
jgi:hypothetical protein